VRSQRMTKALADNARWSGIMARRRSTTTMSRDITAGSMRCRPGSEREAKAPADWNEKRRERAAEYNRLLTIDAGVQTPYEPSWSRAVYHLYVVRTGDRDGLMAHLSKAGIGTGIHYPIPLHRQRAYEGLGYKAGDFPVTERVANEIVSLPMFPHLTADRQATVVGEIRNSALSQAKKVATEPVSAV
jgi:hypothetical protein